MTANRMHEWGDNTIGFEQVDAPVTNTLQVQAGLADGNVEVSFRSTWAQAGASHSTDGALVLSRVDAEALAAVLAPREAREAPASNFIFASGDRTAPPDLGDRRFFTVDPPGNDRLDEIMLQVARMTAASNDDAVRAALIARGWLPPDRLEAIAASWDGVYAQNHGDVGKQLRKGFKNA